MLFYPEHARVPAELRTEEFLLRPLRATDAELDHDALMESKEMLRRWSQSDWPADNFTVEDNLKDLEKHEQEHLERRAFTFTVMSPTETECLGCVYINPLLRMIQEAGGAEVDIEADTAEEGDHEAYVSFWVRQSRLADDLDKRLLDGLIDWFNQEWAFSDVVFATCEQDERQVKLLDGTGLALRYVLEPSYTAVKYLAYG
jgi:RimJ/RimL family protein N-acetyltransferase